MTLKTHEYWMRLALEEAERAMQNGEIPVAAILVSDNEELERSQTLVARHGTLAAHAELFTLLNTNGRIYAAKHPIIIYTTLEPCLMCLGAAMQVGVDKIIYAMDASPDGASRYVDQIRKGGQRSPEVIAHVMEEESVRLMRRLPEVHPQHPAIEYVHAMLDAYRNRKRYY